MTVISKIKDDPGSIKHFLSTKDALELHNEGVSWQEDTDGW